MSKLTPRTKKVAESVYEIVSSLSWKLGRDDVTEYDQELIVCAIQSIMNKGSYMIQEAERKDRADRRKSEDEWAELRERLGGQEPTIHHKLGYLQAKVAQFGEDETEVDVGSQAAEEEVGEELDEEPF